MNSRRISSQTLLLLLLLPSIEGRADEAAAPPTHTSWHELPLPAGRGGVTDIAVEPGGVLWSLVGQGAYYWDGSSFRIPAGDALTSGYYLSKLIGGTDRGLYASQSDKRKREGKLYRLQKGSCEYVTDFRFDVNHEPPGLYVSRWGHIYNWGKEFLAVFVDGVWQRHSLNVGITGVQAVEVGDRVCILGNQPEKLFVFDKSGAMSEHNLTFGESVPLTEAPKIFPWGPDRLLALSREVRSVFAYDVASGKSIDISEVQQRLNDHGGIDAFDHNTALARADGSVWLRMSQKGVYSFDRISPTGAVERIKGTSSTVWRGTSSIRNPDTLLETRDGALWLIPSDTTVIRFQAGRIRKFDWRDGLSYGQFLQLREGRDGTVFAASFHSIAAWRPTTSRPVPQWTRFWNEYWSDSYSPIRDSDGNVWMLLRDRHGEISRWDGAEWHHQKVPFDTAKIYGGMADDQGHVLLTASQQCHDVSPKGVTTFADMKEAVVAAVARGVKRFDAGRCIVHGKDIWLGFYNREEVHRYDGEGWESLPLDRPLSNLFESTKHGVLIKDEGGTYYDFDGERLKYVTDSGKHTRWLWSSRLMQPFESKLLDRRPGEYAIVQKDRLAVRRESGSGESKKTTYLLGDAIPHYAWSRTLTRGWRHGHWTDYGAAPIYRFLGTRSVKCDWRQTPLLGRDYELRQVIEDRAGNLWIRAGRQTFMKQMSDFGIQSVGVPKTVGGEVQIDVQPIASWHGDYEPLIFWRIGSGPWQGGEANSRVSLPVPAQGARRIEIMGMDRHGGTTEPLKHRLEAAGR